MATILIIFFQNKLFKMANLVQFKRIFCLVWRIGGAGLGPSCLRHCRLMASTTRVFSRRGFAAQQVVQLIEVYNKCTSWSVMALYSWWYDLLFNKLATNRNE